MAMFPALSLEDASMEQIEEASSASKQIQEQHHAARLSQSQWPPTVVLSVPDDAEMRRVFVCFDAVGDGWISPFELVAVSRAISQPSSSSHGRREVVPQGFVHLADFKKTRAAVLLKMQGLIAEKWVDADDDKTKGDDSSRSRCSTRPPVLVAAIRRRRRQFVVKRGSFFHGVSMPHGGTRSGTYIDVCCMQESLFPSLARNRTRVCQRKYWRSSSSGSWNLLNPMVFIFFFLFFIFSSSFLYLIRPPPPTRVVSTARPRSPLIHSTKPKQPLHRINGCLSNFNFPSEAGQKKSPPPGNRHREPYIAGDEKLSNPSVARCELLHRLGRPRYNRCIARSSHPAVLAIGDTSAHRRCTLHRQFQAALHSIKRQQDSRAMGAFWTRTRKPIQADDRMSGTWPLLRFQFMIR